MLRWTKMEVIVRRVVENSKAHTQTQIYEVWTVNTFLASLHTDTAYYHIQISNKTPKLNHTPLVMHSWIHIHAKMPRILTFYMHHAKICYHASPPSLLLSTNSQILPLHLFKPLIIYPHLPQIKLLANHVWSIKRFKTVQPNAPRVCPVVTPGG